MCFNFYFQSKLNCEILHDDLAFEARWAVAGESIVIQLVSKLEKGEYMSFGLSGQIDRNVMIGGDVVVTWIDHETLNGYAYDYYLDAKSQCAGNRGSCPDIKLSPNTENIRLLNAALVNGYSIVTYQRPLRAYDDFDLPVYTNGSQAIIWAIGPLNSLNEVSYHSITSKGTTLIDFGRPPQWNCPIPESDASVANSDINDNYESSTVTQTADQVRISAETTTRARVIPERKETETAKTTTRKQEATPAPVKGEKPWDIPAIQCYEPEDGIFYAQMGPTGGKRGYSAITGHVGWGISWYINGLLIPEINVVRGRTYTFVVEGGLDPEIAAKYHPFYITDDPVGGYAYKTREDRSKVKVFAGVVQNKAGEIVPTGVGRLCNWTPDPEQPPADEFASFGAYQRTLSLVCDHGEPGVVQWTPDENTPDTVYYQCFSHRYLGWKINVLNSCDKEEAESEQVTTRVHLDENQNRPDEPLKNPSNRVEVRMKSSSNSTTSQPPISVHEKRLESKTKAHSSHSHYKDGAYSDFTESEQYILQDPYLPPPPYQKNFDYQSMQMTEPMKETKIMTEIPVRKEILKSFSPPTRLLPADYPTNYSKPYPPHPAALKHKHYPYKEPYLYKGPAPLAQFEYQVPAPGMHIHMYKHPNTGEPYDYHAPAPAPAQKQAAGGRPYRHSIMIKKPVHKFIQYNYPPRPMHYIPPSKPVLPPKPAHEPLVSGSMSVKSVITPPSRAVIPKMPPSKLMSQAIPQQPLIKKQTYINRKREEMKPQQQPPQSLTNRIEEHNEAKFGGGFNPNTIVIESGFKPIIPNLPTDRQSNAQDRMTEDADDYVEQELNSGGSSHSNGTYSKDATAATVTPATSAENATSSHNEHTEHAKNPFAGKEPEQFEPMFIPSPVIDEQLRKKKLPPNGPAVDHQQQRFNKVKLQKPDPKISYVWPNDETHQSGGIHNIRDVYYDYSAAPSNTISNPSTFKGYEKPEAAAGAAAKPPNFENFHSPPVIDANHDTEHNGYKVTETDERSNSSNPTETTHSNGINVDQNSGPSSKYMIKYIPVGYAVKDTVADSPDSKLIIKVPEINENVIKNNSSTTSTP